MVKTKIWLNAVLVLVVLTASIYVMMPDKVKFVVEDTRSKIYVMEDDKWVLGGTEYVHLYDGTKKMRAKSRDVNFQSYGSKTKITRVSKWKDGITTTQIYYFDSAKTNVESLPVKNRFICENCEGKIVHYEFRDISYSGITRPALSPENFGHKVTVEWEDGYDWAKLYQQKWASDKLIIRYRPERNVEEYFVRMFDPTADQMNVTLNAPSNAASLSAWNVQFNYTPDIDAAVNLINCSLYGNFSGSWAYNQSNTSSVTSGAVNSFPTSLNLSSTDYIWNAECCGNASDTVSETYGGRENTDWTETNTGSATGKTLTYSSAQVSSTYNCIAADCGAQTSKLLSARDQKALGKNSSYYNRLDLEGTRVGANPPGAGDGFWAYIKLGNGTDEVTLKTFYVDDSTPIQNIRYWRWDFDYANENVSLYDDGVLEVNADISGITNYWYPIFEFKKQNTVTSWDHYQEMIIYQSNTSYLNDTTTCENATSNFSLTTTTSPVASSVTITPSSPLETDNLTCSYTAINSTGGSTENETVMWWYVNDVLVKNNTDVEYCYQEEANISTYCGGSSDGAYANVSDITFLDNLTDGDWTTYGYPTTVDDTTVYFYSNYTIPANTSGAIYQFKYASETVNVTLDDSCLDSDGTLNIIQRIFRGTRSGANTGQIWTYCNDDSYAQMQYETSVGIGYFNYYESAVYWNVEGDTLDTSYYSADDTIICGVEPCDSVCGALFNSSAVTVYDVPDINLEVPENITVELGSIVNLRFNTSDTTVCIDINHSDYGVNYSCGTPPLDLELNITYFTSTTLNDSDNFNLTYASTSNQTRYTDNLHEYTEIDDFTLDLLGQSNGGSYPHNVSVYVNDSLSNTVGNLETVVTTISTLNDSSSETNLSFVGLDAGEVKTVYVEIPSTVTLSSANLTLTGYEWGGPCYQETATEATDCGGTNNDGEYWDSGQYVYVYYEIPDSVNRSLTNWSVKHAMEDLKNVSVPVSCYNDSVWSLRFRMRSYYTYIDGSDYADSDGECNKGNDEGNTWDTLVAEGSNVATLTYDDDDNYDYLVYDADYSTYGMYIDASSTDSRVTMWVTDVNLDNEAKWYGESIYWYYDDSYPNSTFLELGSINGIYDWNWSYSDFVGPNTTSDLASTINTWLATCTSDDDGNCQLPLYFGATQRGKLQISNISFQYSSGNVTQSITLDSDLVSDYLSASSGSTDVPITIESTKGIIEVSNINISYAGGNQTYQILAHNTSYSQNYSSEITYYYSDWTYDLPSGIDFFEFIPQTPTTKDVAPYGQSNTKPILNFTGQNYGGKNMNLSMYLNESESGSCVNLTFDDANTSATSSVIVAQTWTDITNNQSLDESSSMWMWADYQCSYAYWSVWGPDIDLVACCYDCDICDRT